MKRRTFVIQAALAAPALTALHAQAADLPKLDEKDPAAIPLGYKADTTKVDQKKFPKHAATQKCANCSLYQGGTAAWGACPIFTGKQVAASGWCSAWVLKPGA